jgi:glucosamine 6-phosphate synthetase-like amidotransferase/phosphosugar isomerase protein
MCSIFGYVARQDEPVDLSILRRIINVNIARGPHAFGFAWVDSRDRLHCFKSPGRLTDHIKMLPIVRDARMLIGHLRYATHGDAADNANNHPHPVDGGWLVHNGIVTNYDDVLDEHDLYPSSVCDSEAIAQLVEQSEQSTFARRTADAIEVTSGNLATLSLWARPGRLIAARRGNPLFSGASPHGLYLASLPAGLPGAVRSLKDHHVAEYDRRGVVRRRVAVAGQARSTTWQYDFGNYRGG